jgi:hypothetical protein
VLRAPFDGVVLGMTTLPAVSPGEPVCHIGRVRNAAGLKAKASKNHSSGILRERVMDDLAADVLVVSPNEESTDSV